VIYLDIQSLLRIARRTLDSPPIVRDYGLLQSALFRPRTDVFGKEVYPSLAQKAGALLYSLARNHALLDGNKRLAWAATVVFCKNNGVRIEMDDDQAYELVVAVAAGAMEDVDEIAALLVYAMVSDGQT
jgi:death-on-curing protein